MRKIFVIGNNATGKTTLCKELAKQTGWPYICMDELILRFPNKTMANIDFVISIFSEENCIVEMLGEDNEQTRALFEYFDTSFIVKLDCPEARRLKRLEDRILNKQPYGQMVSRKIYDEAHVTMDTSYLSVQDMIDAIMKGL